MRVICPMRNDAQGAGHYGAPRGSRTHRGVDYACPPGAGVLAVECGTVTKLGHTYADDLSYRYVEITDDLGCRARYFYVEPAVARGDYVMAGDVIGHAQDIAARYPDADRPMTNHVHFELINAAGNYTDPSAYAGD